MLKSFRFVLFPLSVLYGFIIWLRNKLYDKNIYRSVSFNFPIICVGNLSVGGTGKTPVAAWIARALGDIARAKGMTQLAKDAGLSRESLYRALSADGNPSFATVLKVAKALGVKLHAEAA